jgi:hypothetical protein
LRVVGGPRIHFQTRRTARQSQWVAPQPYPWAKLSNRLLDSSSVAKWRQSLRLDPWPPNNPQIQTRCSRAVFECTTQVNPASSSYFRPCDSFNSKTSTYFLGSIICEFNDDSERPR